MNVPHSFRSSLYRFFPTKSKTQPVRLLRNGLFLLTWGLGLWGSLLFTRGEASSAHSICGIWGCGPPTHVLIGWHLFWLVLFAPICFLTARNLGGTCLLHLGQGLLSTALMMLAGIVGLDLFRWFPDATELQRSFLGRRILFSIATTIEVPALQILVIALACVVVSRFKQSGENCSLQSCVIHERPSETQHFPNK